MRASVERVPPASRRAPLTVPLRVAVVGNSMPLATAPWGHGGHQTSYPRQLERVLAERGVAAQVVNEARQASMVDDGIRHWEQRVYAYGPDVVVAHYGVFECVTKAVPRRLERYVFGWNYHGGRIARRVRPLVLRAWPAARAWQRLVDRTVGLRSYRMRPERFAWELRHFISLCKGDGDPLVLVPDVQEFGGRYTHWMPHMNARRDRINDVLRRVVAEFDDTVRVVELSALVDEAGGPAALPDGVHFSAELNRRLAELVADEIEAW